MLVDKVKSTIEKNGLIKNGDSVIVALSGGPDSVCLLHVLGRISAEYGIRIYAAHLNHKIRGIEAQKDAVFCVRTCDKMGIVCFVKAYDVPAYSKEHGLSIEEGARKLRYGMFFELKESLEADSIAVAHNLDDQAETVLMRMMRGSGIEGIRGMDYKREDGIIRPLLDVTRKEIENYIRENNIEFRIDQTNMEEIYSRNKVRLSLIPYIEENFNPNIKKALSRMSRLIGADCEYLNFVARRHFESLCILEDGEMVRIDSEKLSSLHRSISTRIIRMSLEQLLSDIKGFEAVHIEDALRLAQRGKDKSIVDLPRDIVVVRDAGNMIIGRRKAVMERLNAKCRFSYELDYGERLRIEEVGLEIESQVIKKTDGMKLMREKGCVYLDRDKIEGKITVRSRNDGDRIRPLGLGGSKKIKDILIDMKVERRQRDKIPIIEDEKGIMWVYGYRIGEDYKVDSKTVNVVKLSIKKI